ncbi:MAG: redox-sensing transcriptional repressor Rex [Sphingobacteriia bacterium]|jgi:redox-sensing transcriptional repressor|nr:redox-sensing transcriptional repressor Rex [Paludibacteraceae bacterium]NCA78893.1 redox-sensing transcriptional repressor Rex [Sphingobacteriia bacterium]
MPDIFFKIPEPALRRLPWYLAYAKLAKKQGVQFLSSTQIAKKIGIDASLVAKDFSYVTISGKTRVGYDVNELIFALDHFLGFSNQHEAFLFGVGSLGSSLLHDNGLLQYGLKILAAFDVKHELVGTQINRIPIHHVSHFMTLQKQTNVHIGVLTVPVDNAQEVADVMIAGGIHAIWNFTPFRIRVPENIVVQNTSMYAHLALMFNRLREELEMEKQEEA